MKGKPELKRLVKSTQKIVTSKPGSETPPAKKPVEESSNWAPGTGARRVQKKIGE